MKAELRRAQIIKLLEKTGILSVGELADRFALSVVTIRKDLDDLACEGLLQRTFGGAFFSNGSLFNSSFRESARQHGQQKHAIATAAMEYIQDGDTVILDAGTTTLALAQLLREQVKSAFIRASEQTYVLVDSSKYDHNCLSSFTRLCDVALTITDSQLTRSKQKALENAGAKLRIVDLDVVTPDSTTENPAVIVLNAAPKLTRNNVKNVGVGA